MKRQRQLTALSLSAVITATTLGGFCAPLRTVEAADITQGEATTTASSSGVIYADSRTDFRDESKSQPPLQVVVWVGPHKGQLHTRPKGRVSQALLLVRL